MKDQLLILVEALRMARAELEVHRSRRVKNAPRTVERLEAILYDPQVVKAMRLLAPGIEAPSVVPGFEKENHEVH